MGPIALLVNPDSPAFLSLRDDPSAAAGAARRETNRTAMLEQPRQTTWRFL